MVVPLTSCHITSTQRAVSVTHEPNLHNMGHGVTATLFSKLQSAKQAHFVTALFFFCLFTGRPSASSLLSLLRNIPVGLTNLRKATQTVPPEVAMKLSCGTNAPLLLMKHVIAGSSRKTTAQKLQSTRSFSDLSPQPPPLFVNQFSLTLQKGWRIRNKHMHYCTHGEAEKNCNFQNQP